MQKEVLIAGAGVIGCLLGKVLKKKNISFKILEKNSQPFRNPSRTVALTSDSIRFLNTVDSKLDLNAWATPVNSMNLFQDAAQALTLDLDQEKISSICALDDLHEKLLNNLNDDISWDTAINSMSNDKLIEVSTSNGNYSGQIIIASDGTSSKIRELSGCNVEEWFYGQKAHVCLVKSQHNNEARQYFSNFGTLALLPLNIEDEEHYSIILCTNITSDPKTQLEQLNEKYNLSFDLTDVNFGNGFELKHSRATKLYENNVILCGDAANTFHPMAGQGLNLGIGDVIFINDNLDDFMNLNQATLGRYSKERSMRNLQMTWIIQSLYGAFGNANELGSLLLKSGMGILDKMPVVKQKIIDFANRN